MAYGALIILLKYLRSPKYICPFSQDEPVDITALSEYVSWILRL